VTQSGQGDGQQLPAVRPAHEGVVLPADGSEPWIPGVTAEQVAPAGGQPWGGPWGPEQAGQQPGQPGQPGPYAQQAPGGYPGQQGPGGQPGHPGQQSRQGTGGQSGDQGQPGPYGQPVQGGYGAQPLPPQAPVVTDSDATQYIPPVAPVAPVVPGPPGALPPEAPADSTQFLGTRPLPDGSDADATQYIAPVPPEPGRAPFGIRPGTPGDRQPPAEFDSLFRTDGPPPAPPADATARMPHFAAPQAQYQQQQPYPQQQFQQPQYEPQGPGIGAEPAPRRRSSPLPLIAAVVVGCAVLGLGVSAMMFGGDDKAKDPGAGTNVAASSPAPSKAATQAAADPAKPQAEALDKLLADSNNSRSAVIRSVENIKQCKNLDQAAADLSSAADQRRALVTRLEGLTVDKLPDHDRLTASLTTAWQASASADDHYAAWAKQAKSKKVCKGGSARSTSQTAQGNRASGEATKAKLEASGLWNKIAAQYGLTQRRGDQL
jgi:hypothetical protein